VGNFFRNWHIVPWRFLCPHVYSVFHCPTVHSQKRLFSLKLPMYQRAFYSTYTNLSKGGIQIIKDVAWIFSHIDAQLQIIFARNGLVVSQNWILLIYIWCYVQKAFHSWFDRKCSSMVSVKCHKCARCNSHSNIVNESVHLDDGLSLCCWARSY